MARKAIYKHATEVDASTYPDDGSSPVGTTEWNEAPDAEGMFGNTPQTTTISIVTGDLTVTDSVTVAAAQTGTTDTLDKLLITNTNEYDLIYLFAKTGQTITLTNTASPSTSGQVKTISGADEVLSTTKPTILIRNGNYWYGYGGGSSTFTPSSTDTLTNKTFDANGTGNSITNIENADIASGAAIAQSKVASLTTDLALKAPKASPTFTGTATADVVTITGITTATGMITANGGVTGALTGNASGSSGSCTGNSATATTATTVSDDAITLAKMASGTDGNLITYDTNGDPAYVATGTSTHVLTSNGAGVAPTFQAAAGGGATIVHAFTNTQTTSYTGTASSFGTVGVGDRDIYIKKIDANNEGVFTKIWKNGAAVEVQIA